MRTSRDTLRTGAALAVVLVTLLAAPAAASVNLGSHTANGASSVSATTPTTHTVFGDGEHHHHEGAQSRGSSSSGSSSGGSASSGSSSSGGSSSGVTPVTNTGAS